ncbi:hypothetical protein TCAL_09248 [Tigriopus californicus]|uniref:Mitochondrial import inner membrane translocase subunit TIM44 n=1 Tax=Tigriopus californicus TaxID=6832 RepID=A0A553N9R4_TIGCA|nr:mitochondrial import inner membrane translocase subunit TIM44-like [Tigriopus californicus]TRY62186.1 hypothetical protein TCAL_09248 [Tigriopus californicus]|eukprot:TCALIF_09248-PA protein Name:"Similar to Timm44 Mitochondrial import inner membrane translocase subunit TIM44 (Mus musculus)" AED:0.01 eAED:0.01 QI:0/-1/0/1/-1/1/1/0/453
MYRISRVVWPAKGALSSISSVPPHSHGPGGRASVLTAVHPGVMAPSAQQIALYSADKRPGFFGNILKNIKDEYSKNQDMQESLKKFREEAKRLEDSEALKEARRKFENIEGKSPEIKGNVFKQHVSGLAEKVKGTLDEVSKHESIKKATEYTESFGKRAEGAAKAMGSAAENIGRSGAFKVASSSASTLKDELEGHSLGGRVYSAPASLRKRKDYERTEGDAATIEANIDATGVELHKDSKFYQSWQNFKDNNPVVHKFVDYRMKYEESDNPLVRGARIVTDKVQDIFGGLFSRTELSEVLTEIVKMDPNFCKEQFLKDCERDIIPNILEAMVQGNLEILQDWCYEAPYNVLATPIKQAQQLGYFFDSKVLDIENIDLIMGKMMEQGPVLVISFQSQQILCVRDAKGNVKEGDPEKVMSVAYVWVLCRDQTELDPRAAWRLLELSASSTEQFL